MFDELLNDQPDKTHGDALEKVLSVLDTLEDRAHLLRQALERNELAQEQAMSLMCTLRSQ